jgi:hypothetical protein
MFGQWSEPLVDPPEPPDAPGVVVVVDGVVVVVVIELVPLEDEPPVAACVMAAAPPAIVPASARVRIDLRRGPCIWLSPFVAVESSEEPPRVKRLGANGECRVTRTRKKEGAARRPPLR